MEAMMATTRKMDRMPWAELQGSEKQIAWADSIRREVYRLLSEAEDKRLAQVASYAPGEGLAADEIKRSFRIAMAKVRRYQPARWWIDGKQVTPMTARHWFGLLESLPAPGGAEKWLGDE
jgi:hypothetical protein